MNTMHKKNKIATAVSCAYVSLALSPVYASDVEIYTQAVANASVSPVVMMMFDTSGSMEWCINSTRTDCVAPNRRQDVLQKAMRAILNGDSTTTPATTATPGYVKMGLSRYQGGGDGGWVTYPARPLDAFVAINPDGDISANAQGVGSDSSGGTVDATSLVVSSTSDVGLYFPTVNIPLGATITDAKITLVAKTAAASSTVWQVAIDNKGKAEPFNTTSITSGSRSFVDAASSIEVLPWAAEGKQEIDVKALVQSVAKDNPAWCGGNGMAFRLRDSSGSSIASRTAYSEAADPSKAPKLTVTFSISPTKTDSCIAVENTSTFYLGGTSTGSVDAAKQLLDDAEWQLGSTKVTTNNGTLALNKVTGTVRTQVGLRLTTAAAIPPKATIKSAVLSVTPDKNYPIVTSTSKDVAPCLKTKKGKCTQWTQLVTTTTTDAPQPTTIKLSDNLSLSSLSPPPTSFKSTTASLWNPAPSSVTGGTAIPIDVKDMVQSAIPTTGTTSVSTLGFVLGNTGTTHSAASIYAVESGTSKGATLTVNWTGEIRDLSALTTVRKELTTQVNNLTFKSSTPLGAAFSEVSRYVYGMKPYYQSVSTYDQPDSRTVNYSLTSSSTSTQKSAQRYISPIEATSECSGNYIFLLTDGAPTVDADITDNNYGITGKTSCSVDAVDDTLLDSTISSETFDDTEKLNWRCMFDLAKFSNQTKTSATAVNGVTVPIKTSTVILGPEGGATTPSKSGVAMKRVAELGGGTYQNAKNTQDLVNAMTKTINSALDQSGVLASPGVAINQFNRLNTLDQVYYVLFDPSTVTKRWDGNLKRYKLDLTNESVKDVNGNLAVNDDGSFKKTSQSWWGTTIDGSSSTVGGAAAKLPAPDSRKMYTSLTTTAGDLTLIDPTSSTFVTAANAKSNSYISPAVTDAAFKNLLYWYKGYNIDSLTTTSPTTATYRNKLGGGLHSRAALVNYGYSGTTSADAVDPTKQYNYIFFSTLGSTLHAVNANDGVEVFSFIPGEKLSSIKTLYDNVSAVEPEYGMDLTWTVYRKDANVDGQINSSNDKIYLYGGMRMGGRNYYGLDLSGLKQNTTPKMLFSIIGGQSTGAYANLGQTWSQPVVADVKINGTVTTVLVFGGGYDECYEDKVACSSTQQGHQLYIVDAVTGDLIWWASSLDSATKSTPTMTVPSMTYSMPSQPKVMDINSDGLADTIYIGDLGGQVFRADIDNKNTAKADLVKRVKLVAQLGTNGVASAVAADNRRIYEPPTVALFKDTTLNKVFAAVAIGTGNRSRPLNTIVDDRYATIFDFDVTRADLLTVADTSLQPTVKFSNMTFLDLAVSGSTGTPTYSTNTTTGVITPNTFGWYVNLLSNGEKSLATGIIYLNRLLFTTYSPEASQTGCAVVAGSTNLYEMCMPYGNQCDAATLRRKTNIVSGLGSEPQLVVQPTGVDNADGSPQQSNLGVLIKTRLEKKKTGGTKTLTPLHHWREKTRYPAK